jgi:uncharacterized protein (TIGR03435 family)
VDVLGKKINVTLVAARSFIFKETMRTLIKPTQIARITLRLGAGVAVLFTAFYWPSRSFGQATPTFEVASVRASKPETSPGLIMAEHGRLSVRGFTVETLVEFGWHVRNFQVAVGDAVLPKEGYDITAKGALGASDDDLRLMVRALLEDRFKLSLHSEMRKLPIYALVVDKNGPKIRASDGLSKTALNVGRGMIDAKKIRLSILCQLLSSRMDRPVQDLTGLTERYDFSLRWTPEDKPADRPDNNDVLGNPIENDGPSIFTAVQEQLGLKLAVQKAPVTVLVIDKVERPTEN